MIPLQLLSPEAVAVLDAARSAADRSRTRVALVGGAVRDLLIGVEVKDLDFVAEGNVTGFVSMFAGLLGVDAHHHERFGTWRLNVRGLEPVDVVTARSERYEHSGALPSVTPGTIEDDLARRDFPLNCIGWDIRTATLIDPVRGLDDLESRILRILHARSFEDDPTRVLRLFRIAERYGFSIEPETLRLAREAIASGMLARVSRERLRREIELAIDESAAGSIISRFAREGILDVLFNAPLAAKVDAAVLDEGARLAREYGADRRTVMLALVLGVDACLAAEPFWGPGLARKICLTASHARRGRRLVSRTADRCRLVAWAGVTSRESLAASLEPRFRELRAAWEAAGVDGECLQDLVEAGAARGRALRKARLALASGGTDPAGAVRIARAKALKYLENR